MRTCTDCNETKPLSEYKKTYRKTGDTHLKYCKTCYQRRYGKANTQKSREWVKKNPLSTDVSKFKKRIASIKHLYGFDEIQVQNLLNQQRGCCGICQVDLGTLDREYHIDHDHETGEVRGLLCPACNHLLGYVEKQKVNPLQIVKYLGMSVEMLNVDND